MGGTCQEALNPPPRPLQAETMAIKTEGKKWLKLTLFQNMYNLQDWISASFVNKTFQYLWITY